MKTRIIAAATLALLATPTLARHHDRDGNGPGRPPAIVLFTKPGFQGRSYFTDHEVRKLSHKDMDDKVSSIRVLGGVWQVCKDDDFDGRCEIVDRSMPDTSVINMDDKISSVRPVPPGMPGWRR
ncbi:beta/gamma crystallin-related protein [Sphingomonas oryzagri]|jgi:hypothetical protein|uniref:Beta/gamma crystallin-related protein n=1 Tax=Sphingomonas oryzagri TaxID=3042314 RepID=A0ABT6N7K7_9SPHN|nr:beta/gamma crystallin-related protein [Sphingomonas oryzagri]MDH7641061.1 beta/gamma crystallin-related protein [Sphingomonas oryzagri]